MVLTIFPIYHQFTYLLQKLTPKSPEISLILKIRINVELYLTGLMLLENVRGSDVTTVNL